MASSGVLRRLALVRTDVSEELSAYFIRVVFLSSVRRLLVTANVVPSSPILVSLMTEALSSSDTSVLTRATRLIIPEEAILQLKYLSHHKCQIYFNIILLSRPSCYSKSHTSAGQQ
jgi:hypothetical protein